MKRHIDAIDRTAERHGSALRACATHVCKPFGWNRRTLRERAGFSKGEARVECKTIKDRYERAW
jgi:hypothetical protein